MKTAVLFISLLLMQSASSSFKEGIDRVMSNVESTVSKFLSDVITDMKDVIDCTMLAVKQALSLGLSETEYQQRCLEGYSDDEIPNELEPQSEDILVNEVSSKIEQAEDQLSSVVEDINRTLHKVIEPNDIHDKLDRIRHVLRNETDHLASVSTLFKSRLEKVTDKIKQHPEQDSFFSEIFEHLKMLSEAEKSEQNAEEIREIHDVINEIYKILQVEETKLKSAKDEDKIQAIINKLSQHDKTNETQDNAHYKNYGHDNFTDTSIHKEVNTNVESTNTPITETPNKVIANTATETTSATKMKSDGKKSNDKTSDSYEDPFDLSSLFEGLEDDKLSKKHAEDFEKMIEIQKTSESIINKYFNNPSYILGDAVPASDVEEMSEEDLRGFDLDSLLDI